MLFSLYYCNPILLPKTLTNSSFPFLATHKTVTLQTTPQKPSISHVRCSAAAQTQKENVPKSAIERIADKLRSLGIVEQTRTERSPNFEAEEEAGEENKAGEIFIPLPEKISKYRVGHTIDSSWSTPENPVPKPGSGAAIVRFNELNKEVGRQKWLEKKNSREKEKEKKVPTLAELKLSADELTRLRTIGIGLKKKLKIGKAGITEGIVNGIHERWRNNEVVKIVCEDLCRLNMKRTHDMLEMKTGGMVVWRAGSKIVLYRGENYKYPYFLADESSTADASPDDLPNRPVDGEELNETKSCSSGIDGAKPSGLSPTNKRARPALIRGVGSPYKLRFQLPGEVELVEEADCLLDGLGPRFTDWWGYDPQPVDADLLPAIVTGYRRPFRLLPFGVQPKLTNDEMTTLRRLARPLPCHFALGRNRKLQGLAAAIVKLWEKCEIAKIAVKRGVQNTNSEMMAEELKWLTGGTLLSRDREFITFYRGKDFLPPAVSSAIEERRKHEILSEKRRIEFSTSGDAAEEPKLGNIQLNSGDNVEPDAGNEFGSINDQQNILCSEQKKLRSVEVAVRRTSFKLSMALEKKAKADKLLAELEEKEFVQQTELDKEGITKEERYMLRKVGLRMKAFLLMGRRGVFDGTVENMHLHWKYRELVKIISKQKSFEAAYQEARTLEAESGGILVAVENVSKGYAIIVYRGKNYERPECLRPKTLLTKREAMKRSLEAQRRESLKLHVLELARNIDKLKLQLVNDKEANTMETVDKSKLPLAKEEMCNMQSANCMRSDIELKSDSSSSLAREEHGADSTSTESNDPMDATIDDSQATQQYNKIDISSTHNRIRDCETEFESSHNSVTKESQANITKDLHREGLSSDSASLPDNSMLEGMTHSTIVNMEHCSSDHEPTESSLQSAESISELSNPVGIGNVSNETASRAIQLSNRDRLLLRRQALRMKKRPVLAVGRSNIVTGVAKAINAHFRKHPLAIVNVKGRAKGTSVQEVVSKLQEETGAVLVSQEPSKVILYRGWGAEDESNYRSKKNARQKTSIGGEVRPQPAASPELLEAIRLECVLEVHQERQASL
ncbi:Chloroplastic group IIA intron splicing facilitator CRS1, chloroplastic [Melia azedarach]|uniref:Chloroplastic group IIA intron splicing facilitator CRS1, chloroplastic n=1 Tax=Melia azedarach TaxID=155640 RepID=A0ACC1X7Z8_MELAZ|nr:Chloroplastic group IIA intron splicing facilitator CRS1, chloroplastic [Melia azedarach]